MSGPPTSSSQKKLHGDKPAAPFAPIKLQDKTTPDALSCTWPSKITRHNHRIPIPTADMWIPRAGFPSLHTRFLPSSSCDTFVKDGLEWEARTHPEGSPYFRSERNSLVWLTEADVRDHEIWEGIKQAIANLKVLGLDPGPTGVAKLELANSEIFLGQPKTNEVRWSYYIVDHQQRSIFWLQTCECSELTDEIGGVHPNLKYTAEIHLKQRFEVEYWRHVEFFPDYDIPRTVVDELLGTLSHNAIGTLTAEPGESVCSFSSEEMNTFRDNIKELIGLKRENATNKAIFGFVTCSMARLMGLIMFERFTNFHGTQGARLNRRQKVRPPATKRPKIFTILSFSLFFAPDIHLRNIEDIFIDRSMVLQESWKNFIMNLIREWEGLVLYSTVLLNANVAFLAIPGVIASLSGQANSQGPPPPPPDATAAEIVSQMSTITSIGSVITSMLLARYHKPKEASGKGAADYINEKGLYTLAILYSLPFALLIWSMVTFAAAVMLTCFNVHSIQQKAITGAGWVLISTPVLWVAYASWMDNKSDYETPPEI